MRIRRSLHRHRYDRRNKGVVIINNDDRPGCPRCGPLIAPKPVVYDADKVPGMKGVKGIPTRELDAFEKKALKKRSSPATICKSNATAPRCACWARSTPASNAWPATKTPAKCSARSPTSSNARG